MRRGTRNEATNEQGRVQFGLYVRVEGLRFVCGLSALLCIDRSNQTNATAKQSKRRRSKGRKQSITIVLV